MTKDELEKLLELLTKYKAQEYPEDTGSSEESDLNSVIGDVEFSLENFEEFSKDSPECICNAYQKENYGCVCEASFE